MPLKAVLIVYASLLGSRQARNHCLPWYPVIAPLAVMERTYQKPFTPRPAREILFDKPELRVYL